MNLSKSCQEKVLCFHLCCTDFFLNYTILLGPLYMHVVYALLSTFFMYRYINVNFLCNWNQNRSLLTYNKANFFFKKFSHVEAWFKISDKPRTFSSYIFSQTSRQNIWTHVSSFNSRFIDFIYMQFLKRNIFMHIRRLIYYECLKRIMIYLVSSHKKVLVFKSLSIWISIISVSTEKLFEFCTLLFVYCPFQLPSTIVLWWNGVVFFFHYYSEKITFGKFINVLSN